MSPKIRANGLNNLAMAHGKLPRDPSPITQTLNPVFQLNILIV